MHPAPSVILFTTLSGLGFGLLIWLGLGLLAPTGWVAFAFFVVAYLLAVGGLLASVFHLGHPERAPKAFTQWRTSWLSREAWLSVAALIVMAIYGAGLVFWGAVWAPLGWLGAGLCAGTVLATSMIYTQMKPVPRWRTWLTPALFLALSLGGGALLAGQGTLALILLAIAAIVQIAWWLRGDGAFGRAGTTLSTATGLGHIGAPRSFEPPHTGSNYLTREFIHVVGRRHAQKLRAIAFLLGYVLPILLLLGLPFAHIAAALAVLCHIAGILASRWLFFAEAEHVVGLYYGKRP
ncbi:dimethyl sulfoxide reductase anchor subunit family protein [Roseovarius dicentrarchi]|uniref:dimethyl sulfoxide reductase anchor subunit family protein n=1 Tax=Roseovarius dicentrarchi TaxID=2250573 RepID=UPI000DE93A23|nr:DmsC/YnfH family molybdoenzyme membrane anchor subunit [Roseovarius dicentrarchi]